MVNKKSTLRRIAIALLAIVAIVALAVGIAACGGAELTSLKVKTAPTKTKYIQGEKFDPTGMVIVAVYGQGDGASEKEVTDYVLSPSTDKALKTSDTSIQISWTEGEKTVSAKQRITVTNNVTDVEKLTDPAKLEYMAGEIFNPTGMTVRLTYQDGTKAVKSISEITSLVEYSNSGILTADDAEFTVTVAGKPFTFNLTFERAVFIEAENGLLNGKTPTGENIRTDATLSNAQSGAQAMFEAQLKANFKKQNESMSAEELKTALEAYVAGDDFKAAVDEYLESPQYEADVEHYRASGETYLGDIRKGDTISFLFNADKASSGSIQFRLASGVLVSDDNWTPTEMGNVQFNQLCEFYVNGVKYDIDDGVTLEGGKSPDGTPIQVLWVNWKNVPFDKVSFIEGRNVVELRILPDSPIHSLTHGHAGMPNIDSLIISTDDDECTLSPILEDKEITYKTESVTLAEETNNVVLTIKGSYTVPEGYAADLLDRFNIAFDFGATVKSSNVVIEDGEFTVTADISNVIVASTYTLKLDNDSIIKTDKITAATTEVSVGGVKYALTVTDNSAITVVVSVTVSGSVEITEATLGTDIKLEVRDNRVYYVIAGGTYTATVTGYDGQDDLKNRTIAAKLKDYFYFDLQGNPYMQTGSWEGDWNAYCKNAHTITVGASNSFELAVDITDLNIFCYTTHCGLTTDSGSKDFKPNVDSFNDSAKLNGKKYEMVYVKGGGNGDFYGCVGIRVTDAKSVNLNCDAATLEVEGNNIYAILTGTYDVYTTTELQTIITADYETDAKHALPVTVAVNEGEKTLTVKIDVTEVPVGRNWMHVLINGNSKDFRNTSGTADVVCGNKAYAFKGNAESWGTAHQLNVTANAVTPDPEPNPDPTPDPEPTPVASVEGKTFVFDSITEEDFDSTEETFAGVTFAFGDGTVTVTQPALSRVQSGTYTQDGQNISIKITSVTPYGGDPETVDEDVVCTYDGTTLVMISMYNDDTPIHFNFVEQVAE